MDLLFVNKLEILLFYFTLYWMYKDLIVIWGKAEL